MGALLPKVQPLCNLLLGVINAVQDTYSCCHQKSLLQWLWWCWEAGGGTCKSRELWDLLMEEYAELDPSDPTNKTPVEGLGRRGNQL